MGNCGSTARGSTDKAEAAVASAQDALSTATSATTAIAEASTLAVAAGAPGALAAVAMEASSAVGSVVPWLVGAIDTFVPSLPFGDVVAKLVKKCYAQACALQDAQGEAQKLAHTIALLAQDMDDLNSVLAAVDEAVEGGALVGDSATKVGYE